jgi:hypothetical protein
VEVRRADDPGKGVREALNRRKPFDTGIGEPGMKFKIELLNYYMFLVCVFVFAALMGGLYYITSPGSGSETVPGFAFTSLICGGILIYLGYTKRGYSRRRNDPAVVRRRSPFLWLRQTCQG